jgi:uncharacterized protein
VIKKVSFKSGEETLSGNLIIPDDSNDPVPAVVFYHGSSSDQSGYIPRAEAVSQKGIVCLTFDFRGCGESEGSLDEQTFEMALEDALAGFDFLVKRPEVDKSRVGICGRSFGGYLASIVSGRRDVGSLVLSVPAIYKDEWIDKSYMKVEKEEKDLFKKMGDFGATEATRSIKRYRGPILVIGHGEDDQVPRNVVEAYFNSADSATKKEIVWFEGAKHRIERPEDEDRFRRLVADWFSKTLLDV